MRQHYLGLRASALFGIAQRSIIWDCAAQLKERTMMRLSSAPTPPQKKKKERKVESKIIMRHPYISIRIMVAKAPTPTRNQHESSISGCCLLECVSQASQDRHARQHDFRKYIKVHAISRRKRGGHHPPPKKRVGYNLEGLRTRSCCCSCQSR